jgi:hypothetical protein
MHRLQPASALVNVAGPSPLLRESWLWTRRLWEQFHQQTLRLLCGSDLRVAHASFAVHVRNGALLHPATTVFLRVRSPLASRHNFRTGFFLATVW